MLVWLRRADRRTWLGLGFAFLMSAPAVGMVVLVLSQRSCITADRYGYLPLLGVFLAMARLPLVIPRRFSSAMLAGILVWLAVAIALAPRQVARWQSNAALWAPLAVSQLNDATVANHWTMALVEQWEQAPPGVRRDRLLQQLRQAFAEVLAARPGDVMIRLNWAEFLRRKGEGEAALEQLQAAAAIAPDEAVIQFRCALLLQQLQRPAAAQEHLRRLLTLRPDHEAGAEMLAGMLLAEGRFAEAEPVITGGLSQHPANSRLLYYLACLHEQRGNSPAAEQAYRQVLANRPDADAAYNLANLLMTRGATVEAEEYYRLALKVKPNQQPATINLGGCLLAQGRAAEALAVLDQAAAHGAESAVLHYHRGMALLGLNRRDEAVRELRRAQEFAPGMAAPTAILRQLGEAP